MLRPDTLGVRPAAASVTLTDTRATWGMGWASVLLGVGLVTASRRLDEFAFASGQN